MVVVVGVGTLTVVGVDEVVATGPACTATVVAEPPPRHHPSTATSSTTSPTALVAGGASIGSSGWPRNAERFDPVRGRWSRGGTLTTGREGATATLLGNGRVLLAGGGNPSALASAELHDPTSGNWSATGSMTAYHPGGAAALLQDGRVLVAGYSNQGDVYSPAAGTWTATGPLVDPGLQSSAAALHANGQVLYAGGERFSCGVKQCFYEPTAKAELYTP